MHQDAVLEMSTVPSKGQVTIPSVVRRAIGVGTGDKVLFVRRDDGTVSLFNQNMTALRVAAGAFAGAAEEAGLESEEDLAGLVRGARAEMWEESTSGSPRS